MEEVVVTAHDNALVAGQNLAACTRTAGTLAVAVAVVVEIGLLAHADYSDPWVAPNTAGIAAPFANNPSGKHAT